jgi:hypothetical protein
LSEWFVYQPGGQHVGPLSTDALARGLATGKVPRDAHVARAGGGSWQLVTAVFELASAPSDGPVSPSVPPAPPPRATLPPAATALPALESTLPSKKRGTQRTAVPRLLVPAAFLGASFVVATAITITSVALPHAGAGPSDRAILANASLLLVTLATLAIPVESANVRVTVASMLLVGTLLMSGDLALVMCVTQAVSVALSALMLRSERAYFVAWGLVPGVALIGWVCVLLRVV